MTFKNNVTKLLIYLFSDLAYIRLNNIYLKATLFPSDRLRDFLTQGYIIFKTNETGIAAICGIDGQWIGIDMK